MGEEFQGGVCGGNWWNTSRNLFRSSPCSMAINGSESFGWPNHDHPIMDMKTTKSSNDSTGSNSDVWNQDLLHDTVRSDENYSNILPEVSVMNSNMNYQNNPQISKNFYEDYSFKQLNQSLNLDQTQPLDCSTTECVPNFQELSPTLPLNSASYSLLQTLFDSDSHINYSNEFSPASNHHLNNFTNTTPFWNATAAPLSNVRTSFRPSTQSQFIQSSLGNKKPNTPSLSAKRNNEDAKKTSNEPGFKRQRMETPSPLPTFKVRKEKLGDRITALQQLVSPFGKTDTASVLHEAIDYIKFLHDQVSVLSTPYLKNGSLPQQHQQAADRLKDQNAQKLDLKSRGLCLVPISSTFPMATETTSDFWTPTFSGSFR